MLGARAEAKAVGPAGCALFALGLNAERVDRGRVAERGAATRDACGGPGVSRGGHRAVFGLGTGGTAGVERGRGVGRRRGLAARINALRGETRAGNGRRRRRGHPE